MQAEGAWTLYLLKHKDKPYHDGWFENWSDEPSPATPFHAKDGVSIWVSPTDLTPDDDFLGQASVDVVDVLAQKFPGQDAEARKGSEAGGGQ